MQDINNEYLLKFYTNTIVQFIQIIQSQDFKDREQLFSEFIVLIMKTIISV